MLAIGVFDTEAEAIPSPMNRSSDFSASVWTRDKARGEKVARQIQAGAVLVNDLLTSFGVSEAPHGGVKASGIGRTHGVFGVAATGAAEIRLRREITGIKQLW